MRTGLAFPYVFERSSKPLHTCNSRFFPFDGCSNLF